VQRNVPCCKRTEADRVPRRPLEGDDTSSPWLCRGSRKRPRNRWLGINSSKNESSTHGTAWPSGGFYMPITAYDFNIDPETKRALDVALEITRISLGLEDNFANEIITKQLIELAKAGERNPYQLCEGALSHLREHLFGD
jgi:hypothetical protein